MEVYLKIKRNLKLTKAQLLELAALMDKPDMGWEEGNFAFCGNEIECSVSIKIVDDYEVVITVE